MENLLQPPGFHYLELVVTNEEIAWSSLVWFGGHADGASLWRNTAWNGRIEKSETPLQNK